MLNDLELMNILAGGLQKQAAQGAPAPLDESQRSLAAVTGRFKQWLEEAVKTGITSTKDLLAYIGGKGVEGQRFVAEPAGKIQTALGEKFTDTADALKKLGLTVSDTVAGKAQAAADKARGAWESTKKGLGEAAAYAKGKWDAGNDAIVKTAPWQKFTEWMKAKGLKAKGAEGGHAFLHRMGRSLTNKPLKWGGGALGTAGLLGTGLYAALSGDDSDDSALGQIGDATGEVFDSLGMEDIPDSYRGLLAAGAIASPVLGAAAGGISGNGMLRGAAQGLGLAGGSYAGYKGGKALADYLENSDMLSGLGSGGKDAVRLASILGGTALGGIGGTSLAGALVPKGY